MSSIKVLLAGESWVSSTTHYKGWDYFSSAQYETGADDWIEAVEQDGYAEVEFIPGHEVPTNFPLYMDQLKKYDVVVLSDIGANSLLLPPQTFIHGQRTPNRLKLLEEWVKQGGALVMAGGYLSFQGIQAAARFQGTKVEEVLPVTMLPYDDRLEVPEGFYPEVTNSEHPILSGIEGSWPYLLGLNMVAPKEKATVILQGAGYPLLVVGEYGRGRSVAWATDIGPHWCPREFVQWSGFGILWRNILAWCAGKNK